MERTRKYQLRRYTIEDGALEKFARTWMRVIPPIRRAYGFEVHGSWLVKESNQFVWIVSFPESYAGEFEAAERRYLDAPDRHEAWPDPKSQIVRTDVETMVSAAEA